eukprot:RCo040288
MWTVLRNRWRPAVRQVLVGRKTRCASTLVERMARSVAKVKLMYEEIPGALLTSGAVMVLSIPALFFYMEWRYRRGANHSPATALALPLPTELESRLEYVVEAEIQKQLAYLEKLCCSNIATFKGESEGLDALSMLTSYYKLKQDYSSAVQLC